MQQNTINTNKSRPACAIQNNNQEQSVSKHPLRSKFINNYKNSTSKQTQDMYKYCKIPTLTEVQRFRQEGHSELTCYTTLIKSIVANMVEW